jgi:glucose-6-phosphate 1-epimerase
VKGFHSMSAHPATNITAGLGGMPKARLASPDGAQVEVYLHGAHVTSWIPAGGDEQLFLSQKSQFQPGAAIRGGVPVIFPQFGGLGTLPKHGFARTLPWDLTSLGGNQDSVTAEFCLTDTETTREIWPHPFLARMRVSVGGLRLRLELTVANTGNESFSFTAALHTYLRVDDILTVCIEGLHGLRYHDTVNRPTPADWVEMVQTDPEVIFLGEIDRVYHEVSTPLKVYTSDRITSVTTQGFPDAVIWNPGPERSARLVDLEPDGYRHMVCVEAAIAGTAVTLQPAETWQGAQLVTAG